MTTAEHDGADVTSMAAAVAAEAQDLVLLWERADDGAAPRIPPSQLRVLGVVARYGPMNLTRLSQEMGSIPSSASRLCDRLEAAGLLVRQVSPNNKREVVLTVSEEGHRRLNALAQTRAGDFARVLDGMSPQSRAALRQGLAEFGRAVAAEIEGVDRADGDSGRGVA
ncbi:MarR family winged helix-turn-helix transcriptional regulator [Flexivirga lutea]